MELFLEALSDFVNGPGVAIAQFLIGVVFLKIFIPLSILYIIGYSCWYLIIKPIRFLIRCIQDLHYEFWVLRRKYP